MKTKVKKFKNYSFITIKNSKDFEVSLCTCGASIYYIKFDKKYMTQTQSKISDFLMDYHGKTIGRVCNRLKGNKIKVGRKFYTLENNEGLNTLHGGRHGVSSRNFDYKIIEEKNKTSVIFSYLSKDLESGFPGDMKIEIKYDVFENNKVLTSFKATTNKLTMCSLTNHAFYCLGEKNIEPLELMIDSKRYLHPNKKDLLPVEIKRVDKIMDFSNLKMISKDINSPYLINSKSFGYDHYFYFNKNSKKKEKILLKSNKYSMSIETDFSGVQIYTDNWPSKIKFRNSKEPSRRGVAIEPSESQFELHYLKPNEEYKYFIKLNFKKN